MQESPQIWGGGVRADVGTGTLWILEREGRVQEWSSRDVTQALCVAERCHAVLTGRVVSSELVADFYVL